MLPNIHPPVDRSEKARQQHVKHRVPQQTYRGAVSASSDITCQFCMAACDQLEGEAKTLCKLACSTTIDCW